MNVTDNSEYFIGRKVPDSSGALFSGSRMYVPENTGYAIASGLPASDKADTVNHPMDSKQIVWPHFLYTSNVGTQWVNTVSLSSFRALRENLPSALHLRHRTTPFI